MASLPYEDSPVPESASYPNMRCARGQMRRSPRFAVALAVSAFGGRGSSAGRPEAARPALRLARRLTVRGARAQLRGFAELAVRGRK
jgi:hypothetical protein